MDVFCYPSDWTMDTVVPKHPCTHELAGVFACYEQSEPLLPCQTRVRQESNYWGTSPADANKCIMECPNRWEKECSNSENCYANITCSASDPDPTRTPTSDGLNRSQIIGIIASSAAVIVAAPITARCTRNRSHAQPPP
jgi:hypothetical protein